MKDVVILYSGGLDSFILYHLAKQEGYNYKLVHFDIGQGYNKKEMEAIRKFEQKYNEKVEFRKVEWLNNETELFGKKGSNSGNIYIPGRNMVLASLAASIYLPDEVWLGGLRGEDHPGATDKNQTFIDKMNNLWSYVYSPFEKVPKLVFPFLSKNWGKFEAVEWLYKVAKVPVEDILNTSSCLSDEDGNCGHCIVCCRRKYIFKQLGFEEQYNKDPLTGINNLKMIIEMLEDEINNREGHYNQFRRREIIPGLMIEFNTNDLNQLLSIMKTKLKEIENESSIDRS